MRGKIGEFEVSDPRALNVCAEFMVDSQSSDPHFAGPIDIRVEPERLGIRWSGSKTWAWLDWHELTLFVDQPHKLFAEKIRDIEEHAREEGIREGLKEAAGPPEERKSTVTRFVLLPEQALEHGAR